MPSRGEDVFAAAGHSLVEQQKRPKGNLELGYARAQRGLKRLAAANHSDEFAHMQFLRKGFHPDERLDLTEAA